LKILQKGFPTIKMVNIGKGLHFIQEDNPHTIGKELAIFLSADCKFKITGEIIKP
jgi:hypothetical protein